MNKLPTHSDTLVIRRHAFTLVELLVVISIIAVLMTLAFPAISLMQRLTRGGAAETTIGVAVRTAAAYAVKPKPAISNPNYPSVSFYSNGAAILFTPNGDIRILESDRLAKDTAGNFLQVGTPPRFGYKDIEGRDYINLPSHTGIVGIIRTGPNPDDIKLIPPPFAVRFDRHGQLSIGSTNPEETYMVYYDANGDGRYDLNSKRDEYTPEEWDSRDSTWNKNMRADGLSPALPFERIETVIGVLLFSMNDLKGQGHEFTTDSDGFLEDDVRNWLLATKDADPLALKNAKTLFFSRSSGAILREYR